MKKHLTNLIKIVCDRVPGNGRRPFERGGGGYWDGCCGTHDASFGSEFRDAKRQGVAVIMGLPSPSVGYGAGPASNG